MAAVGLVWCGPFVFLMIALVVFALLLIPTSLLGIGADDWPGWLIAIVAIIALILTVLVLISVSAGKVQDQKDKQLIRDAEVQRAKRELGEPTGRQRGPNPDGERLREELRREREERRKRK